MLTYTFTPDRYACTCNTWTQGTHACRYTHTHAKPPKQWAEPTELNKQFFLVSTGEKDYLLCKGTISVFKK